MPIQPVQYDTKTSPVGTDIIGFSKAYPIGGVSIDNPTNSWLSVNTLPGGVFVPPMVLGWATPLAAPKASIDVRFVASPFGTSLSVLSGSPISVTIYENSPENSIALSPGIPISQPPSNLLLASAILPFTPANVLSSITLIAAPGAGFQHRLWAFSFAFFDPPNLPLRTWVAIDDGVAWIAQDSLEGFDGTNVILPSTGQLTLAPNRLLRAISFCNIANVSLSAMAYYTTEPV